jgi:ATP-binding cassette subfamily F protein 3
LSGGEKGRLALAKLIYSNKNVLILDEPTNHLDIPSREALEAALDAFQGTIITVSHDRYFLDRIATQILSFEENGKVEIFNGNYSEFHEWQAEKQQEQKSRKAETEQSQTENWNVETEITKDVKESSKEPLSKNQRQRIEQRISEIEKGIPSHEELLSKLSAEMSKSEVAANHQLLQEVTNKIQQKEKEIQNLYSEWEELLEKLNQ